MEKGKFLKIAAILLIATVLPLDAAPSKLIPETKKPIQAKRERDVINPNAGFCVPENIINYQYSAFCIFCANYVDFIVPMKGNEIPFRLIIVA